MKSFLFHVGLPKAASTTLQSRYLRSLPGYLGKNLEKGAADAQLGRMYQDLKDISKFHFNGKEISSAGIALGKKLLRQIEQRFPASEQIIISEEHFVVRCDLSPIGRVPLVGNPNPSDGQHEWINSGIIEFLSAMKKQLLEGYVVRVILVLRNQPDWLGSMYSQRSVKGKKASQADFERQVGALIAQGDETMFWATWVERLRDIVGAENVCVLLMEDLDRELFWRELVQFTGSNGHQASVLAQMMKGARENVRSLSKGSWETTSDLGNLKGLKRCVGRLLPREKSPRMRSMLRYAGRMYNRVVTGLHPSYDSRIEMTAELRRKVLKYTLHSNRRLAELLGRDDLQHLGY